MSQKVCQYRQSVENVRYQCLVAFDENFPNYRALLKIKVQRN